MDSFVKKPVRKGVLVSSIGFACMTIPLRLPALFGRKNINNIQGKTLERSVARAPLHHFYC
jgi:hypothetical protein